MTIALVTDGIYPYVIGGMQKHSFYLAKYLAKHGVKIQLYHFTTYNKEKTKEEIFGIDAKNIEFIELDFPVKDFFPFHYLRESKQYSKNIYSQYKQNTTPDVLICKGFTGWEFVKRKMAGEKLPPLCVNFHGYEMFQEAFSLSQKIIQPVLAKPVRFITLNADYCFSYGGKITDLLKNMIGVSSKKILEFPSGIENHWLNSKVTPPKEKIRFAFVGRNEPRKGLKELNEALRSLLEKNNWQFNFIGEVPTAMRINSEKIIYHELITDQEKIKKILQTCDVLVCPSWSEGMPNVILEAMASGLAILATDVGATRLLVNEKTGWLINKPHPAILKNSLEEILNLRPEIIFQKKIMALQHVKENFLWESISALLLKKLTMIANEN
jgi:glycosyltransferase involved in cell wall biosynthesis